MDGNGKINWDQYFMSMAYFVAMKSKDNSTKIGAVVVGPDNEIRSTGYNGLPRGVHDNVEGRQDRPLKYSIFEHGERNSIYNAARMGLSTDGCKMYTQGIPCSDCARAVIQSGITTVVYHIPFDADNSLRPQWVESCKISEMMLREAGVEVIGYNGPLISTITGLRGGKVLSL